MRRVWRARPNRRIALVAVAALAVAAFPALDGFAEKLPRSQRVRQRVSQTHPAPDRVDTTPPRVRLRVPERAAGPHFRVVAEAVDESGVVSVVVSLDGTVVGGRTDPPYRFELTARHLPVRVKVVATDAHGNAGTAEAVVLGPPEPCACPEIFDPVCGADGRTYANACQAECAGVEIAHPGPCDEVPCDDPGGTSCGRGRFCEFPAGTCEAVGVTGHCQERPQACPRIFAPVCGCDGRTYGNDCERQAAGVSLRHGGACEPRVCGGTAAGGLDCREGQFCERRPGQCEAEGLCQPRPRACPLPRSGPDEVVCGCDGRTYATDCERRMAGASIRHRGACEPAPICGGIAGFPCPEGQACDLRDRTCQIADLAGRCVPVPVACAEVFAPVCGCNGVTYTNDCERLRAGATLAHRGACTADCEPAGLFECAADGDCIVVDGVGCCGCRNGGEQAAINKDRLRDLARAREACCRDIACVHLFACRDGLKAVCRDGMCRLEAAGP